MRALHRDTELARDIARPYCLRCYAPLERTKKASIACDRCGFVNVSRDQGKFWTREVVLVRAEFAAKASVVALLVALAWAMTSFHKIQFGMGQGFAIGFPILSGVVLWQTAEMITRRKPYFRPSILWGAIPMVLALPVLIAALWPSREIPLVGRLIAFGIAAVLISIAVAVILLCKHLARWRDLRILHGQADVARDLR